MSRKRKPSPIQDPGVPGVIYVGRTEGELITVLGKVGYVRDPTFVGGRVVSYRVADRVFSFVLEAAFGVELKDGTSIRDVEGWVHIWLKGHGLTKLGENYVAPDSSMTFLARMVATSIEKLGLSYRLLDIEELQAMAKAKNSKAWQTLDQRAELDPRPDIYQSWLTAHAKGYNGMNSVGRDRDYLRSALALGYLVKDLATGSDLQRIDVNLSGGTLYVYPDGLAAAWLEAKAEADLYLGSTTSYSVRIEALEQIPISPVAMTVMLDRSMEHREVTNTFLAPTSQRPDEVSFAPDYLGAIGLLGGAYGESCLFEGLGVRALIPLEVYQVLREYPDDLPGVRFWLGVQHCAKVGIRIQDFDLPRCLGPFWDRLSKAALVMLEAGFPVPDGVQAWVAHAWLPSEILPDALEGLDRIGE